MQCISSDRAVFSLAEKYKCSFYIRVMTDNTRNHVNNYGNAHELLPTSTNGGSIIRQDQLLHQRNNCNKAKLFSENT